MYLTRNEHIEVYKFQERLIIKNFQLSKEYHIKYNDLVMEILENTEEPLRESVLYKHLNEKLELNEKEFNNAIQLLLDKDIVKRNRLANNNNEDNMYSRQIEYWEGFFNIENGDNVQQNIENLHVVIVGAGGIGSWSSLFLTQLGVKKITLIDDDLVDKSNITRQVMFDLKDVGKSKVEVLQKKLTNINNTTIIDTYSERISSDATVLSKIKDIDIVINCADEPNVATTSSWINHFCYPKGIPFCVGGGYSIHSSKIGTLIIPGSTPCWECYIETTRHQFYNENYDLLIPSKKGYKGAINLTSVMTATIQINDILKYISGLHTPLFNSATGDYDLRNLDIYYSYFRHQERCVYCNKKKGDRYDK